MPKDIINTIKSAESLSKGQKRIASYIIEHFDKAAYMTASRLGSEVGVSESTVVRFATELGYNGYPSFQQAIQETVSMRLTSVQRIMMANGRIGNKDVLSSVLSTDIDKLKYTMEHIDRDVFDKAVNSILEAKTIYIIGMRSSSILADFMYFYFAWIFENVRLVRTTSGSEIFEQLMKISSKDVMIAISFPRYSSRIVNAVDFAKEAGAKVISITDSSLSPIADGSFASITVKSDMTSFVDSLVAPLSIINALIASIGIKKQDEVSKTLSDLEAVWDKYDIYSSIAKHE